MSTSDAITIDQIADLLVEVNSGLEELRRKTPHTDGTIKINREMFRESSVPVLEYWLKHWPDRPLLPFVQMLENQLFGSNE